MLRNLLAPTNQPYQKKFPPYIPGKIRPDNPPPTTQPSFTTPASTNIRALLTKLLTPGTKRPPVVTTSDLSNTTVTSPGNKLSKLFTPTTDGTRMNLVPFSTYTSDNKPMHPAIQRIQDRSNAEKARLTRKRKRDNETAGLVIVESSSENESNDSSKTVTLRSGRKVKVPSWRQDVLEDNLKNNRRKLEEITDVHVKQERVSPTFPEMGQDDDDGVRVEFDFDILADLKKESLDDQSDNSSWSGTVMLTSEDDATPSKVPFKFTFQGKNKTNSTTNSPPLPKLYDDKLSSLGLARKPIPPVEAIQSVEGRFDYITVFDAVQYQGSPHFCCKLCSKILPYDEGLKDHCFRHDDFLEHYFICEGCDKECTSREELALHIQTHPKVHLCHVADCSRKFMCKKSLIEHLNRVHKELYSCPRCNATFITSRGLSQHLVGCIDKDKIVSKAGVRLMNENWISVQDDGKIAYKCRSCQTSFPSVEEYNQHMLQHKSKFVQQINEKFENEIGQGKPSNKEEDRTCEVCSTIFETEAHLTEHKAKAHENKVGEEPQLPTFKCTLCNVEFDSQVEFSSHCTKMHPQVVLVRIDEKGDYSCSICSKRMRTKEGFDTHMKMHNNEEKKQCTQCGTHLHLEAADELHCCITKQSEYTCEECSLCFYSQKFLAGHRDIVHGERMDKIKIKYNSDGQPTCNICGKIFKKESEFQNHKTLHTGEHPFCCHLCQKTFRLRSTLKTHLMTHRDYHEFMCEICGRTFKLVESLRLHRRLHNKKCHFKCKYCSKEFRAYDGLKYHMLKDHKEAFKGAQLKIYKCEYCDKDMATHQQYVRHVSIHTNEKPLKCDYCDTRWATVSQLNAHKKKHDEENLRHNCNVCNIKFPIISKLKRHIRTSKHIENCKLQNLPVNTTTLKVSTPPSQIEDSPSSSRIIDNVTNEEEKVEIMFYEINLPEEENSLLDEDGAMIYDIVVPDKNGSALVENVEQEDVNNAEVMADSEVQNSDLAKIVHEANHGTAVKVLTLDDNSLDVALECTNENEIELEGDKPVVNGEINGKNSIETMASHNNKTIETLSDTISSIINAAVRSSVEDKDS